jgi:hypothetical protein
VTAEIPIIGAPKFVEIKKIRPTAVPTVIPTVVPTKTFTPVPATFTPVDTATKVPVKTPTPEDTATKVPVKKAKKKATPVPTATPDLMLRSDIGGRVFMNNKPVEKGIKMKALSKHTDKVYTVFTDENGGFKFTQLPVGAYIISIDATYIKEKAVPVTVNRGKNDEITINTVKR